MALTVTGRNVSGASRSEERLRSVFTARFRQGLNEAAQAHIRSARMFLKEFDIIHAAPDAKHALLSDRDPDGHISPALASRNWRCSSRMVVR